MKNIYSELKSRFSRRSAFKTAAIGMLSLPWAVRSQTAKAAPTKRLAIIGGGMGGVASAYFAGSEWAVDLYEAKGQLGGHGDTRRVTIDGEDHPVDMGADFFHPKTHPLYWSFLEHIGIRTPGNKRTDLTIETEATLNIFDRNNGKSLFNSIYIITHPFRALNFLAFTQAARLWSITNSPFDVTVGEWLDGLPLPSSFKSNILTPWVASISAGKSAEVRRQSARAHFSVVAASFPINPLQKIISYNAKIGVGGYINLLASQCENLKVNLNAPVSQLEEVNGKWFVTSPAGREGPFDAVVVNAPPHISKNFFNQVPWAADLQQVLGRQEYYPAKITVHTDPAFMPSDAKTWGIQNVEVNEEIGEASIYVGGIFEQVIGKKISLFKSWTGYRTKTAQNILLEENYLHPLTTPEFLAAAKDLKQWQGQNGLYFSGHFTTNTDLQETALYSALETAKRLSPESSKLVSFQERLARENLSSVNYEVP